jgi:hypothetical protein
MRIQVRRWAKNHNAASINYGPLSFSLKIDEKWTQDGGTAAWPVFDVTPGSSWNYGLALNDQDPEKSFRLVHKKGDLTANPFTQEGVPLELRAKARKIPAWKIDRLGLVGLLQDSPVKSSEPLEEITLIPMGAARLRISSFPVLGKGENAHDWTAAD